MWLLLLAGLIGLNDQGGTVHYFDVVRKQIGSDVVLPPGEPELWAPDVGQYHSMLFLQSIYQDVGAPVELFERNQDLEVLIHLSVSDVDPKHYRWEHFDRDDREDWFLHDEDGHRISMYHTAWNAVSGAARPTCDPKGTRPGSAGPCVVYRDGQIVERNPENCNCRFATDLGHPDVLEHFGDWFAEVVGPRGQGYRELAGILLDNMPVAHTFTASRVRNGRVSGIPYGTYAQTVPHSQTFEEFLEDRRNALDHFNRALKAVDPSKIFLFNGCTILEPSEIDIALDHVEMTDGCSSEQWTMNHSGSPIINNVQKYRLALEIFQKVNQRGKYFVAFGPSDFPHRSGELWPDTEPLVDLLHANVLLAWQNPRGMISYHEGSVHSATPTVDGRNTFQEDFPLHDLDCGIPLGQYREARPGVMTREWSRCVVVVNQSPRAVTGLVPRGFVDYPVAGVLTRVRLERATAMVLMRRVPTRRPTGWRFWFENAN